MMITQENLKMLYPRIAVGIWYSTPYNPHNLSAVGNSLSAFINEMLALGVAVPVSSINSFNDLITLPYPSELRLRSSLSPIIKQTEGVIVESVRFTLYDHTVVGSLVQTSAVNTTLQTSASSAVDAYISSQYRNGMIGNYAGNFFRPTIRVNDRVIFNATQTQEANGTSFNLGDYAHGLDVSSCFDFWHMADTLQDNDAIKIDNAFAGQIVDDGTTQFFLRWGVKAQMIFRYK